MSRERRFWRMTSAAAGEDSTKQTCLAPRLNASMPTAPVPANKSSQTLPSSAAGFPAVKTLNRVSRRRSEVGRISIPRNERSGRLRYFPAMTRMPGTFGSHNHYNHPCKIIGARSYAELVHLDRTPFRGRRAPARHFFHPPGFHFLDGIRRASGQREWIARYGAHRNHPGLRGGARVRTYFCGPPLRHDSQGTHPAAADRHHTLRRISYAEAAGGFAAVDPRDSAGSGRPPRDRKSV